MTKSLDDHDKRTRAEVLAACIADVEKALAIYMEDKGRSKDDKALIGGVCLGIKFRLKGLQPSASALEALLREKELDALYWCRRNLDTYCHEGEGVPYAAVELRHKLDIRIAELEKARAISGGK